jgi:hypothetical protein
VQAGQKVDEQKASFLIKVNLLKEESQKTCAQLFKDILEMKNKDPKKVQEAIGKHDSELNNLTSTHHNLKGLSLETASKKAKNEDHERADAKMAHQKAMAFLKLKGKMMHLHP